MLSPAAYNARVGLAIVCPITSQVKGYPFEVVLPDGLPIRGAILADRVKSPDRVQRRAEPAGRAPTEVVREVLARLRPLLGLE
jgi:mRNA interferase MazF